LEIKKLEGTGIDWKADRRGSCWYNSRLCTGRALERWGP